MVNTSSSHHPWLADRCPIGTSGRPKGHSQEIRSYRRKRLSLTRLDSGSYAEWSIIRPPPNSTPFKTKRNLKMIKLVMFFNMYHLGQSSGRCNCQYLHFSWIQPIIHQLTFPILTKVFESYILNLGGDSCNSWYTRYLYQSSYLSLGLRLISLEKF